VVGSFSTATEAQHGIELAEQPSDVIIVELGEISSDEIAELAATGQDHDNAGPVLVALIPGSQQESIPSLLRAGVSAVLPSTAAGEEILAAMEAAFAGLVVLDRIALDFLEETPAPQESNTNNEAGAPEPLAETLTPRERQILDMMAEGLGNKEIAWQLQISEHTVKFHVSSILGKLGVSSRTEAVTQGMRRGLIML